MITPRRVRVLRVATWRGAQQGLAALVAARDAAAARQTLVVVPSRAAARTLQHTIEQLILVDAWRPSEDDCVRLGIEWPRRLDALAWPDMVTRASLYPALQAMAGLRLPPLLARVEREVLMRSAATEAERAGAPPPFPLRPGIVGSMVELYETRERLRVSIDDFERHLATPLERVADSDAGAARLLGQTRFLAAAFRAYANRLAASGGFDEAALRRSLLAAPASAPRHVIVATGDVWSEGAGLWPVDFEFLLQRDGIEAVDLVATGTQLDAGLRERLQARVHDIEELRLRDLDETLPVLVAPPRPAGGQEAPAAAPLCFTSRDREEELADAAARLKVAAGATPGEPVTIPPTAFVTRRPLPYLYLARRVLTDARVAWHAEDALPLAGEPAAAALDLVADAIEREAERESVLALLRSPHLDFSAPGRPYRGSDVHRLAASLQEAGFVRGRDALVRVLDSLPPGNPAVEAARRVAADLPSAARGPISAHVRALAATLSAHTRQRSSRAPHAERWQRGYAAIQTLLDALAAAHERLGDSEAEWTEVVALVHRAIEARTFAPRVGDGGVHLADAAAARFGRYDVVHLLGLVEGEWAETTLRTIFYPNSLLSDLNWPKEDDRIRAARATFLDLVRLARTRTSLSTITLEDDALVRPSILIDDLDQARLAVEASAGSPPVVARTSAALAREWPVTDSPGLDPAWLAWRTARGPLDTPRYRGWVGAVVRRRHSATQLDAYRACPFKYFASRVLRLEEPPRDDVTLDPRRRGEFVHDTLRRIAEAWGRRPIAAATWADARSLAVAIVEEALMTLAPRDRPVERARLLGSASREGLVDVVLALEASSPARVTVRRTEQRLVAAGPCVEGTTAPWELVGQVDRIDELDDGCLRVLDYKTGRLDEAGRWLQLPLYVSLVEAADREAGRGRTVNEAYYVGGRNAPPFVSLFSPRRTRAAVVDEALDEAARVVAAIAAGEFPPRPSSESLCRTCAFALVCRKEFVDVERPALEADDPAVTA